MSDDKEFEWRTFDRVIVQTEFPFAKDSPDHLMPWGTSRDNSYNLSFNRRLLKLFRYPIGFRILDLGCSGGGFVKSCVDDGCLAVGLEGSNYSSKLYRANWPLLGNKLLFTADITKPFSIQSIHGTQSHPLRFNVITMWEVLEHLKEEELDQTFENIKKHLEEEGLFMGSISLREEVVKGVKLHQTVKTLNWWLEQFQQQGFKRMPAVEEVFGNTFIRGPHNAEGSINVVFSRHPERFEVPSELRPRKKNFLSKLFKKLKAR